MSFFITKIVWIFLQPSTCIGLCLGLGTLFLVSGARCWAKRLLILGSVLYIVIGFSPVSNWVLVPLEDAVPRVPEDTVGKVSGIIVLGGALETIISAERKDVQLNDAAERMTEAARLAKLYPSVPVIFSGGKGEILYSEETEADSARKFFASFNITEPQLKLESNSRNTAENARYTAELIHPQPGQRWLLITSAFHMKRAKALFEAQGFQVEPWPVDYRTRGNKDYGRFFNQAHEGLKRMDLALKEWVSYIFSWVHGDLKARGAVSSAST